MLSVLLGNSAMSVFAGALSTLGEAIQGEISLALKGLRDELEQERKLRVLLDDQLSNLKQAVYTKAEVDQIVADLKKETEEKVASAKAGCEQDLRLCQRELEHRIETAKIIAQAEDSMAVEKQKASLDDAHLLSLEIDRKVGTMLVDVDQRLAVLKDDAKQLNSMTAADNARLVHDLSENVQHQLSSLQSVLEGQMQNLQQQISSSSDVAPSMTGKIDAMQKSLEEKIGMVMLELDSRCPP